MEVTIGGKNNRSPIRKISMPKKLEVPSISDESLSRLSSIIKPLIRRDVELYHIDEGDPRGTSFTWYEPRALASPVQEIATIPTVHTWAYYGFFKPTVAEVLSQIPESILSNVEAFETVGPEDSGGLTAQKRVVDAGLHLAATILYKFVD